MKVRAIHSVALLCSRMKFIRGVFRGSGQGKVTETLRSPQKRVDCVSCGADNRCYGKFLPECCDC